MITKIIKINIKKISVKNDNSSIEENILINNNDKIE